MPTDGAGCVGIELPEREVDSAWLDEQADLVIKAINVLYCPWVHVVCVGRDLVHTHTHAHTHSSHCHSSPQVCHSVGALLAMRVAHRHSDRIGTITVIDTPLVNNASMRASELLQALRHSETDPNVTDQEIEAMEKQLASLTVAESVKTPAEADADTFGALLNPEFYPLTYQLHLEKVAQPMMVVRSQDKANPVIQNSDIACYYNTFNVKTILPVDGSDRKSLYTGMCFRYLLTLHPPPPIPPHTYTAPLSHSAPREGCRGDPGVPQPLPHPEPDRIPVGGDEGEASVLCVGDGEEEGRRRRARRRREGEGQEEEEEEQVK